MQTKLLFFAVVCCVGSHTNAQFFQAVPFLPNEQTNTVLDLSGNGQVVVGYGATQAMRYQLGGAPISLGGLPGLPSTAASGVSHSGGFVAGNASDQVVTSVGFRWQEGGGMTAIPDLRIVNGISADGSTVVGYQEVPGSLEARRWSQTGETQNLGTFTGAPFGFSPAATRAFAANQDGSVIVGNATVRVNQVGTPQYMLSPFIWDAQNGARILSQSPGNYLDASATDLTPDGAVIAGTYRPNPGQNPPAFFRWTMTGGFELFAPIGDPFGKAALSADGNAIVVGLNYWSPSTGIITIQQLLTNAGCDFTGWTLTNAVGISDDGRTIAGNGTSPTGQTQAWIATVPAPAAAPLLALAAFARRRRRS